MLKKALYYRNHQRPTKNISGLEHTRHHSTHELMLNLLGGLIV
jgi:hypothetical protein